MSWGKISKRVQNEIDRLRAEVVRLSSQPSEVEGLRKQLTHYEDLFKWDGDCRAELVEKLRAARIEGKEFARAMVIWWDETLHAKARAEAAERRELEACHETANLYEGRCLERELEVEAREAAEKERDEQVKRTKELIEQNERHAAEMRKAQAKLSEMTKERNELIVHLTTDSLLLSRVAELEAQGEALRAALKAENGKMREAFERVLDCLSERKLEICIDCVKIASAALASPSKPGGEVK